MVMTRPGCILFNLVCTKQSLSHKGPLENPIPAKTAASRPTIWRLLVLLDVVGIVVLSLLSNTSCCLALSPVPLSPVPECQYVTLECASLVSDARPDNSFRLDPFSNDTILHPQHCLWQFGLADGHILVGLVAPISQRAAPRNWTRAMGLPTIARAFMMVALGRSAGAGAGYEIIPSFPVKVGGDLGLHHRSNEVLDAG